MTAMLSRYFYVNPYVSWPLLLLINTFLPLIAYQFGWDGFLMASAIVACFLLFYPQNQKQVSYYINRICLLMLVIVPYLTVKLYRYDEEVGAPLWMAYAFPIGIALLIAFFCALIPRSKAPSIKTDHALYVHLDSVSSILRFLTLLFSVSYMCILFYIVSGHRMVKFTSNFEYWMVCIVGVLACGTVAWARQQFLKDKRLVVASGGEWIRIDSNGIEKRVLSRKNGMSSLTVAWKEVTHFKTIESSKHVEGEVVVTFIRPPRFKNQTIRIPLKDTPFKNSSKLTQYLSKMRWRFG